MKKTMLILGCLFSFQLAQANMKSMLTPASMGDFSFNYSSQDGAIYLNCEYEKLQSEPEFYRVTCGKAPGLIKVFDVRFRVRQMGYSPRVSYELVFWVTDRNLKDRYDQGQTTWITLDQGQILNVTMHQDVENSYAVLMLRYRIDP